MLKFACPALYLNRDVPASQSSPGNQDPSLPGPSRSVRRSTRMQSLQRGFSSSKAPDRMLIIAADIVPQFISDAVANTIRNIETGAYLCGKEVRL